MFNNGGKRYIPVLYEESFEKDRSIREYSQAYNNRLEKISQINFTASIKFNRLKTTPELMLDIVSVTNNLAKISEYYNKNLNSID